MHVHESTSIRKAIGSSVAGKVSALRHFETLLLPSFDYSPRNHRLPPLVGNLTSHSCFNPQNTSLVRRMLLLNPFDPNGLLVGHGYYQ